MPLFIFANDKCIEASSKKHKDIERLGFLDPENEDAFDNPPFSLSDRSENSQSL
jgi:hypothetical protein